MDLSPYWPPPAWMVWTIAGVVSVIVTWFTVRAALDGIRYAARSVQAWRHNRATTEKRPAELEDILTWVMAGIATSVSASGMWKFAGDVLQLDGFWRVLFFAFIEGAIVISALRARRSMRENYTAGLDGIAVWALAALTAVLASIDAKSGGEMVFRLAAPMVAAWLWERGMRLERRKLRGLSGINWRLTPERILVRLGLAEARDRTASEVDTYRRLKRVALAAKRVHQFQEANAKPRKMAAALARRDLILDKAVEHTDLATNPRTQAMLMDLVTTLGGADSLSSLLGAAKAPWTMLDHPAITGTAKHEHARPAPEVIKVPVTIRRVIEKPVETIVEKPVEVERVVEVPVPVTVEKLVEVPTPVVPADAIDAARIAYEHSLTGPGRPLGHRTLAKRFGLDLRAAQEIINLSQQTSSEAAPQPSEQGPAETLQEAAERLAQDRHTTATDGPDREPVEEAAAKPAVTIIWPDPEPSPDRHSDDASEPAEQPPASDEDTASPATVTINDGMETPTADRHSTAPETPTEDGHRDAPDVRPVTLSDESDDTPAAPSQRITFTPLTPVFREPSIGLPVTVPEASSRPSRDNGLTAFNRAVAAAAAGRHGLPALNGTSPTASAPAGDQS